MKQNFQRYLFFDILDSFWMGYFLVSYLKVLWYHDPGFDRLFDHMPIDKFPQNSKRNFILFHELDFLWSL